MLARKNRLKKKKEFNYIYKKGKIYHTKFLIVYVVPTRAKESKVGFTISNKIGNSVIRHKLKRRLSEIIRCCLKNLPVRNYVFVAKVNSNNLDFSQLKREVECILNKVMDEK